MIYDKVFESPVLAVQMKDRKPSKKWINGDLSLVFANRALFTEVKGFLQRNTTMRLCFREATSSPHLLVSLLEHVDPVFLSRLERLDIHLTSAKGWPPSNSTMNDFSVLHGFSLSPIIPGRPIVMASVKQVRILVTQLQPLKSGQEIHFLANKGFACGLDIKNSFIMKEHDAIVAVLRRDMRPPTTRATTQFGGSQIKLQRRWGFRFTDQLNPEEKDFDIDSEQGRKAQLHLLHADCDLSTGDVRSETWLNNWQIRKRYHYGKAVAQDDWLLVDW